MKNAPDDICLNKCPISKPQIKFVWHIRGSHKSRVAGWILLIQERPHMTKTRWESFLMQ